MQCSVCGSQDTTIKRGVSKKTGRPWVAYDCNERDCKNEKGYPSRTFAPSPKSSPGKPQSQASSGNIEKKLDWIIEVLKANFKVPVTLKTEISHEELSDETPF